MDIGYFDRIKADKKGDPDRYGGEIELLGIIKGSFRLVAVPKRNDKSPSHRLEIYQNRSWANAGSAWYQKPKSGDGDKYFSCSLQIPALPKPHRFSVFEADADQQPEGWKEGDEVVRFNATWSPPMARASVASGVNSDTGLGGDGIPY